LLPCGGRDTLLIAALVVATLRAAASGVLFEKEG
jgi:hypothetical protein